MLAMQNPPTAIFTAHNVLTIGAVSGLRELGKEFDVALVGFDDFALAYLLQPGVTVIAQDPALIGRIGADILFRRISGDQTDYESQVVPTKLILRGSGEIKVRSASPA